MMGQSPNGRKALRHPERPVPRLPARFALLLHRARADGWQRPFLITCTSPRGGCRPIEFLRDPCG